MNCVFRRHKDVVTASELLKDKLFTLVNLVLKRLSIDFEEADLVANLSTDLNTRTLKNDI